MNTKLKKALSVMLCAVMLCGSAALLQENNIGGGIIAGAADTQSKTKFDYFILNDNTIRISDVVTNETTLVIPEKIDGHIVSGLDDYPFSNCTKVTSVKIPKTVTYIPYSAFWDLSNLKTITVDKDNPEYTSSDGILYNKDMTQLLVYPAGKTDVSFVIPKNVVYISNSLENCKKLTHIGVFYDHKDKSFIEDLEWMRFKVYTGNPAIAAKLKDVLYDSLIDLNEPFSVSCISETDSTAVLKVKDGVKLSGVKYRYYQYDNEKKQYTMISETDAAQCRITGLKNNSMYRFKVSRMYYYNGKWTTVSSDKEIQLCNSPDRTYQNSLINAGATARVWSKKAVTMNNGGLNTTSYFDRWENPSPVCQFKYKNEKMMFAYLEKDKLIIKALNSDMTVTHKASLNKKLPALGTVLSDSDGNYYVVWAQESCSSESQTAFIITKYSSSFKEIGSVSYTSGETDTVIPFDAGNCDAGISGGKLYILYAQEMYSGHQMAGQMVVNISNMKKETLGLGFWCSHSFAQRVLVDHNQKIWYANQGDFYPRSFTVVSNEEDREIFHFYCGKEDQNNMFVVNYTNAQLGGLADTSRGVFFAGASCNDISKSSYNGNTRNLFITSADNSVKLAGAVTRKGTIFGESFTDTNIKWLTNYNGSYSVVNPQIVTSNDKMVVMWEKYNTNGDGFEDSYYMLLDRNGNVIQNAASMNHVRLNAFESPVCIGDYVYWISADGSIINTVRLNVSSVLLAAKDVKMSKTSGTVKVGNKININVTLSPSNASTDSIKWTSSNPNIAAVSNGVVYGKAVGKATITAAAPNGKKAVYTVNVYDDIYLNKTQLSLGKNENYQLKATVTISDKTVKWRTSAPKILTVDQKGNVKAVGTGTAWITVRAANGKESSCKITVKNPPTKVDLTKGVLTLGAGEKYSVTSSVNDGSASAARTYRTSNSSIVRMTRTDWQGDFVAVKPGVAYVTVRTYNGVEKACKVTVKPAPSSVTISKKNMTMKVGETASLSCWTNNGSGCASRTFRSSDSSIIKMTKTNWTGEFKAMKAGTAWVTVRTYNGKESSCKITVTDDYFWWY